MPEGDLRRMAVIALALAEMVETLGKNGKLASVVEHAGRVRRDIQAMLAAHAA